MPAANAAQAVFRFVFDMTTGRPCTREWQQEHGCDLGVAMFFGAEDLQTTAPSLPNVIVGLAADWHRQGLHTARNRARVARWRR